MGTRISSYSTMVSTSQAKLSTTCVTKTYSNNNYGVKTSAESTMTSSSTARSGTAAFSYNVSSSSSTYVSTLTATTSVISSTLAKVISSYQSVRLGKKASYETFTIKSCSYTTYNTLARTSSY